MMFLDKIALALSIVGGLNWGLIGLLNFDLVAFISGGSGTWLARIIYTIVGLAALWCLTLLFRPEENFARLNGSNQRMVIPHIDEELCLAGVKKL